MFRLDRGNRPPRPTTRSIPHRTRGRLQAHGVETGDRAEHELHLLQDFEHSLKRQLVLIRM